MMEVWWVTTSSRVHSQPLSARPPAPFVNINSHLCFQGHVNEGSNTAVEPNYADGCGTLKAMGR